MYKQDIIDRLTTAKFLCGSDWVFREAQWSMSQRFAIYEWSDYSSNHYEVVRHKLGEDDKIITTTLFETDSLKEAIEYYAERVVSQS